MFGDPDAASADEAPLDDAAAKELREKLNAQLSSLLSFDGPVTAEAEEQPPQQMEVDTEGETAPAEEPDELAFEFRLFRDEAPSHTVVIDQNDDREVNRGDGVFVVAKRPNSYYVAGSPGAEAMRRYRFSAVTPNYLFADAKQRRWGLEKPWRVTHITITTGKSASAPATNDTEMTDGKRKRPGKKRRILLRTREKTNKEKAEAAKKALEDKEEHLKAKKQRLNREKKLKRRAKEKEKKSATGGAAGQSDAGGKDDTSDGDSQA